MADSELVELTGEQPMLEELVEKPDSNELVLRVKLGDKTLNISRKAKESMSSALDASRNQPTPYFKYRYVGMSVADCLGLSLVDMFFPETAAEIEAIDWNKVVPGDASTYPKAADPSPETFKLVRTVHEAVKAEKDAQAIANGQPKSDIQNYITYKQKWKIWRDLCTLFKAMNPSMTNETVLDLMAVELKCKKTWEILLERLHELVKKHINKLVRETRKKAEQADIDRQLAEAAQREEQVKKDKEMAEQAQEEALEEKRKAATDPDVPGARSRSQRKAARDARIRDANDRIEEVSKEVVDLSKEEDNLKRKINSLKSKKREINQRPEAEQPRTKKTKKRNDTTLLALEPTPRQKAERDDAYKPPTKVSSTQYDPPGKKWAEEKVNTWNLLKSLSGYLTEDGLIEPPLSFHMVMEFIGPANNGKLSFNERVFVYVVALTLHQD